MECHRCHVPLEQKGTYPYDDEHTGCHYEIPVEDCEYCSQCDSYYLGPKSMNAIRKFVNEYRAGMLIGKYGFDHKHWMNSEEASKAFGMDRKRFLEYGLVNLFMHECNDDAYVFRKSVEKALADKEGNGLFYIGDESKKDKWIAFINDKKTIKKENLEHRGNMIDERCDDCGTRLEHCHELVFNDKYVGRFSIESECDWCPYCREYYRCGHDGDWTSVERRKDNARGEIVEKEYPFDLENWMPLKEALKLLGMGREKFMSVACHDFFILKRGNRWHILKKSLEHYMEEKIQECSHPDGLFKLDGVELCFLKKKQK